jgi:hypothetical protein
MAKKDLGVFIKPLVRNELNQYVDGWGNKRDRSKYNKNLNVTKLQIQPNPFMETITFRALVKSEHPRDPNNSTGSMNKTKKPAAKRYITYLVTVRCHGVKFVEQETSQFNQKWDVAGTEMFSRRPAISRNKVMMKCICRDWISTWEWEVAGNGGLWPNNRPTKYVRKNKFDPAVPKHPHFNAPPRNPLKKMGYCKHIETFLQYLYDEDFIQNR